MAYKVIKGAVANAIEGQFLEPGAITPERAEALIARGVLVEIPDEDVPPKDSEEASE